MVLLHPGHYRAYRSSLSQDALIRLVSWVKAHWRAGRIVCTIFADIKLAFPSVHHPRMIHILEEQQFHPELVDMIYSFLAGGQTYLSFNGFQSENFQLSPSLPQRFPLSSLLYLLYNTSLLFIPTAKTYSASLGFVDEVILMTATLNIHKL